MHAATGSSFLLIEDGVYVAMSDTAMSEYLNKAKKAGKVFALKNDVETRGIQEKIDNEVELVEYADFVNLVVENERVQSWL